MVMPDTGLLDAPIRPTILPDTTAKKKLNATAMRAPTGPPPTAGTNQVKRKANTAAPMTQERGASRFILVTVPASPLRMPALACLKLLTMAGRDFASDMKPPAATAPAPI